jgi:hypothetical protein
MKHLKWFLMIFLISFILIVIGNGSGFPGGKVLSLQESLNDPPTYIISLVFALFFTILGRNW